jgi:hypothetical protein
MSKKQNPEHFFSFHLPHLNSSHHYNQRRKHAINISKSPRWLVSYHISQTFLKSVHKYNAETEDSKLPTLIHSVH